VEQYTIVKLKLRFFFFETNQTAAVGVLNRRLVNLWIARLDSDGVLGGHKDLYWFGLNILMSSEVLLVLPAEFGLQ
jgi:hypothetical protein